MTGYRVRSVNPVGLVLNERPFEGETFAETLASMQRFAASVEAAPDGKPWDGWCVDPLDASEQVPLSVPLADQARSTVPPGDPIGSERDRIYSPLRISASIAADPLKRVIRIRVIAPA